MDCEVLIEQIHATTRYKHALKDKDIVIFMGKSGCGKSTTLHYLSGTHFGYNEDGELIPLITFNEHIKISSKMRSETKGIVPLTLKHDRFSIFACDSAGFNDSRSLEIELANSLSLLDALRDCNSIKPVLLVSPECLGSRGQSFKSLVEAISRLFHNWESVITSFTVIFTKTSFGGIKMEHSLQSIQSEINDHEISDFLGYILRPSNGFISLNPESLLTDTARDAIFDQIIDPAGNLRNPISNPRENFASTNKDTNAAKAFFNQLELIQSQIDNLLMSFDTKFDANQVNYKLDLLTRLLGCIQFNEYNVCLLDNLVEAKNKVKTRLIELLDSIKPKITEMVLTACFIRQDSSNTFHLTVEQILKIVNKIIRHNNLYHSLLEINENDLLEKITTDICGCLELFESDRKLIIGEFTESELELLLKKFAISDLVSALSFENSLIETKLFKHHERLFEQMKSQLNDLNTPYT